MNYVKFGNLCLLIGSVNYLALQFNEQLVQNSSVSTRRLKLAVMEHLLKTPCEHNDRERTLSGTWPSIEIQEACELVYRVVRLIEVWEFQDRSRVY